MTDKPVTTPTKQLRLFKAEDRFLLKGRGIVYAGPCPFAWDKKDGLSAWEGEWLISHPEADHTTTYKILGVESFCLQVIRDGSPIGILVDEPGRRHMTETTQRPSINILRDTKQIKW